MKPYNYEFIQEEMKKYNSIIDELKLEGCSVCKDEISFKEADGYICAKLIKKKFLLE